MAFNSEKYKSILCNLSLICNENIETFMIILEHLKNRYNFNPKRISLDFSKAQYIAFKRIFKNINILPCFYHFCQSITRKLTELKSDNEVLKEKAKDLFSNIKLLCFIDINIVENFFKEIKH